MNSFDKNYIKKCNEIISVFNFTRRKNIYYRIINDVVQAFGLEHLQDYSSLFEVRVEFSIRPLCSCVSFDSMLQGSRYLKMFSVSADLLLDSWRYVQSEKEISQCVDSIGLYISSFLIPFFDKAYSCATALPQMIILEKSFDENRKKLCALQGIPIQEGTFESFFLDTNIFFMALKNSDYDLALKCRSALLNQNKRAVETNNMHGIKPRITVLNRIAEIEDEVKMLEQGEYSYFRELVKKNEQISLQNLHQ